MKEFIVERDYMNGDYRCVVVGQALGHRCGYVRLPKGHLLTDSEINDLQVHGKITYAEEEDKTYPVESSDHRLWIGFDCNHGMDSKDHDLMKLFTEPEIQNFIALLIEIDLKFPKLGTVKATEYVEDELFNLVKQLKSLQNAKEIVDGLDDSLK